jgi:hypothetical protein
VVAKVNAASVPRSERILGRADCLATDIVGDIVRIRAAKIGNRFQVEKVDISNPASPPAVAIIKKKYTATDCIIHFHGPIRSTYTGLTPGRAYLVGSDSRPAKAGDVNYPTGGVDVFQQVGVATSSDELLVSFLEAVFGGAPGGSARFFQRQLVSTGNPSVFTTPLPFKHGGIDTEVVSANGHRQVEGVVGVGDYRASESGGIGTGYDTITFNYVPKAYYVIRIDYTPDV